MIYSPQTRLFVSYAIWQISKLSYRIHDITIDLGLRAFQQKELGL